MDIPPSRLLLLLLPNWIRIVWVGVGVEGIQQLKFIAIQSDKRSPRDRTLLLLHYSETDDYVEFSSVRFGSFCRCWMHEERGVSWLYRTRGASNRTQLGLRTFLVAVQGIPHKRGIPIWYIVYVTQPKDIYFCCWEWGGVGESPVRKETIKFMLDSSDGPLLYAGLNTEQEESQ